MQVCELDRERGRERERERGGERGSSGERIRGLGVESEVKNVVPFTFPGINWTRELQDEDIDNFWQSASFSMRFSSPF